MLCGVRRRWLVQRLWRTPRVRVPSATASSWWRRLKRHPSVFSTCTGLSFMDAWSLWNGWVHRYISVLVLLHWSHIACRLIVKHWCCNLWWCVGYRRKVIRRHSHKLLRRNNQQLQWQEVSFSLITDIFDNTAACGRCKYKYTQEHWLMIEFMISAW